MNQPVRPIEPFAFENDRQTKPQASDSVVHVPIRDPEGAIRVAIIDDDPAILESIGEALRAPFFETAASDNAEAFFRSVEELSPHVVLIDLQMPHQDGVDILRRLREQGFGGEVVVMSGADQHVLETARRMAAASGLTVMGALHKPFTAKQLINAVDKNNGDGRMGGLRIKTALNEREIRPYFQPKVQLESGLVVGAEALSRWHHPERGLLLPNGYLSSVRAAGGQSVHDFSILEGSMELAAKLNAMGHKLKFAVNFTADVVIGNEFLDVVKDALARHGVVPEQLVIELTETDAAENIKALTERLLKLRLIGAHLSIDDFGTGHSSLTRLQQLPVSEIKIDRSFVMGLTDYSDDYAIVRSIVDLAHSIRCPVVAEGVETIDTLDTLRRMGCDMAQGHIFSPAVNEATFLALVKNRTPASSESEG